MIQIRPLKRRKRRKKDVKENPNLVVNGRTQCLVALERFQCLVANGRFQCLVAIEGEGKTPFHIFPLSPQQILLKPSFFHQS
jgi:hypothetical protein